MALTAISGLVTLATIVFVLLRNDPPPDDTPPTGVSDPRINRAFQLRQSGDLTGAIDVLSGVMKDSPSPAVSGQAAQDRAYVYKLQKDWPYSIADLSTALAFSTSPADRVRLLRDRANAYLEISDIDAALEDYKTLLQLKSDDQDGMAALQALNEFLKPTKGYLFVFPRNGVIRNATELPPAVQKLDQISFLNLRHWWHEIPASEVRYTSTEDEKMARSIVDVLRKARIDVNGPTLLSSTVPRSRRVELWLQIPRPPAAPRVIAPSSRVRRQ